MGYFASSKAYAASIVIISAAANPTPAGTLLTPSSVQSFFETFNTILPASLIAMPTVTLPTSGVGTYNGVAVGTVLNNGATYLAGGGFNQTYNFGTLTGTANITNFDGANYSAALTGSRTIFTGDLSGAANRTGFLAGTFFGPSAAVTGGGFAIQNTSGPSYVVSGAFAGK